MGLDACTKWTTSSLFISYLNGQECKSVHSWWFGHARGFSVLFFFYFVKLFISGFLYQLFLHCHQPSSDRYPCLTKGERYVSAVNGTIIWKLQVKYLWAYSHVPQFNSVNCLAWERLIFILLFHARCEMTEGLKQLCEAENHSIIYKVLMLWQKTWTYPVQIDYNLRSVLCLEQDCLFLYIFTVWF